jgi:3-carboxy-cis,cis-muconate cycloisomerase
MRRNLALSDGAIVSERLNAALAPHLGRTRAKKLIARVALHGTTDGTLFGAALPADPDWPAAVTEREVRVLMAPEAYLGSAAALVNRVLTRYHASVRPSAAAESTHRSVT